MLDLDASSNEEFPDRFPLFVAVHMIATKQISPQELIPRLRLQPVDE